MNTNTPNLMPGERCSDCDCRLTHESPDGLCRECRADRKAMSS